MRWLLVILLCPSLVAAQTTTRAEHWTDVCSGNVCTRTLQNNINYYDNVTGAGYQPSEDAHQADGPYVLSGDSYTYRKRSRIFAYGGCTTCASSTGYAVQSSRNPGAWIKVELVGTTEPWSTHDSRTLKWQPHANVTYYVRAGRNRVEKIFAATGAFGQAYIEYDYSMPDSASVSQTASGWAISIDGETYNVHRAVTWDSDNGSLSGHDVGATLISTTTVVQSDTIANGIRTVRLRVTPNAAAVTAAWNAGKTVYIDPTDTISGADGYVEETFLYSGAADENNGGYTYFQLGRVSNGYYTRALFRVDETQIPDGTISAVSLFFWRYQQSAQSQQPNDLEAYIVSSSNNWVEGTASGAAQTGSCDWNHTAHSTTSWAGSGGCSTSGTDYVADATPPTISVIAYPNGSPYLIEFAMDEHASTWEDWRDGVATNNGILIYGTSTTVRSQVYAHASENGAYEPYFEVTYSAGGGGGSNNTLIMMSE